VVRAFSGDHAADDSGSSTVRIGDLAAALPTLLTGIGGLFVDGLAGVVIGCISATAGAVATALDGTTCIVRRNAACVGAIGGLLATPGSIVSARITSLAAAKVVSPFSRLAIWGKGVTALSYTAGGVAMATDAGLAKQQSCG
jgi:hypothetical protein